MDVTLLFLFSQPSLVARLFPAEAFPEIQGVSRTSADEELHFHFLTQ